MLFFLSCSLESPRNSKPELEQIPNLEEIKTVQSKREKISELFSNNLQFKAKGFDYPVGKPNAKGYYNAQKFGRNSHLGDDWNAVTGGNTDLGDPIYSIANGYVNFAEDIGGGWGKVIRIWHQTLDNELVESLYAHCEKMNVAVGQFVKKGQKIGTIGNADGLYLAHLHFEIRSNVELSIGNGYSDFTEGYLDPTVFIEDHRGE